MRLSTTAAWFNRHRVLLGTAFILHLFNNLAYRFIDSYLPLYSQDAGVDEFGIGIIFSAFSFAVCLASPLWGIVCNKVGYKTIIIIGLTIESLMLLCFPLSMIVSDKYFLIVVTTIRCVQGVGSSATQTGCYALIAAESGDEGEGAGEGMGGIEMFGGIGNMSGPLLGGALFSAFNYSTPCLCIGGIGIVCLYAVAFILPSKQQLTDEVDAAFIAKHTSETVRERQRRHSLAHGIPSAASFTIRPAVLDMRSSRSLSSLSPSVRAYVGQDAQSEMGANSEAKVSFLQVLSVPSVAYCCLVSMIALASMSFLDATLQAAFNAQHGLSEVQVGACFSLLSLLQLLTCPLAGWIADKYAPKAPMFLGLILIFIALMFLGPSPFMENDVPAILPMQLFCLALLGCGVSFAVIPTFVDQMKSCAHLGIASQAVVAGLSASVFSGGEVLGPFLGSSLVQMLSFPWCCSIWALACVFTAMIGIFLTSVRVIPFNAHHVAEREKSRQSREPASTTSTISMVSSPRSSVYNLEKQRLCGDRKNSISFSSSSFEGEGQTQSNGEAKETIIKIPELPPTKDTTPLRKSSMDT